MSIDANAPPRPTTTSLRADRPGAPEAPGGPAWALPQRFAVLSALAAGFVLLYGGSLEVGPAEARLGLAAAERLGPFGLVFGGWDPSVWPAPLAASLVWAWGEGGTPTAASVRWPAAIAGVLLGLILARRASTQVNGRAGVLVGLCWFGSVAMIDRSGGAGLDLILGLGVVGALDRLVGRGADWVAGLWASLAFLAGGWPPLAVVALGTVVLGRPVAALSWRLAVPPALAAAAWSAWALAVAPAEAWGAALMLPLTQSPAWLLAPGVVALGLPWAPFAALAACPSVRDGWPAPGRAAVVGWLQIAGACLLTGTLVPGLAAAAKVPALAGLAVAAGASCEAVLSGAASASARRGFVRGSAALSVGWALLVCAAGAYLIAVVSHYRPVAIGLILLSVPAAGLGVYAALRREARGALAAVFALAVLLKVAHAGYYVPEWNYRRSQGPWGRAVGQWVPPRWPIYTTHAWNPDFAFATAHPVRQLLSPQHLAYEPGAARFVLLLQAEFAHWPAQAPPLRKVTEFRDEFDGVRVLARTDGPLPWTRPELFRP